MTEQEKINGWTFEETVKIAENLMEVEKNMFKWDVLRHLRDFAENFKEELKQYRAIGTPEECRAAAETIKSMMERNLTTEIVTEYMKFEDECVKQGFSFNSLLEAREKQTAKKPEAIDYKKYVGFVKNAKFLRGAYWCPNCSHVVRSGAYCDDCGQKLDWSDEE